MSNLFRTVSSFLVLQNDKKRTDGLFGLTDVQHNIPHVVTDVNFTSDSLDLPDALRQHPHREVPLLVDGSVVIFEG